MTLEAIKMVDAFAVLASKIDFDRKTPPPEAVLIPPTNLVINRDYQREISRKGSIVIARIIQGFDWHRFGVLIVASDHAGQYLVIDGQHRAIAALHLGIDAVPAIVREIATDAQASTFLNVNTNRTAVGPIDKFRAKVAAGDEYAISLNSAIRDVGITLVTRPGYDLETNECRSIGALSTIAKKFGIGTMQTALEMLLDAQPGVPNTLANFNMHSTVRAVDRVISSGGDIDRIQTVLEDTVFEEAAEKARNLSKMLGGRNYLFGAKLLIKDYNKGLKTKLSEEFK